MTLRTILLCGLAALGLGCVSVGQEFETSRVPQLEIGVTQREDVRRLLGEPWRTGIEDGLPTWTYAHYRYSLFAPAQTRDLVVRFDAEGVVRSYGFNSTYPADRSLGR
jgi:outer membrane protein assembly factor BamE (lipoprotein component of BamABCDE complex)